MNQEEVLAKLKALENKTLRLIAVCKDLKYKLDEADRENDKLQGIIKKQTIEIRSLSKIQETQQNNFINPHKISKIVSSINADSLETAELKARIDEYIQELNKCITHLSQ